MLTLDSVSFRYTQADPFILQELVWQFPTGTLTAVTAPSGRGKSTLLWLLGLLLTPTNGAVLWDGLALSQLADTDRSVFRARTIGFVFQDGALDGSRTVIDNITHGALFAGMSRKSAIARALELMQHFSIEVNPHRLPGQISGGQAQRVALSRALLPDPMILLADEPTGNLDEHSAQVVWDELETLAGAGKVVVVATHNPKYAAKADHHLDLNTVIG